MGIREDAARYAAGQVASPISGLSLEDQLAAAYVAGATSLAFSLTSEARPGEIEPQDEIEARLIAEAVYGPGEPAQWQLDNARDALNAITQSREALNARNTQATLEWIQSLNPDSKS